MPNLVGAGVSLFAIMIAFMINRESREWNKFCMQISILPYITIPRPAGRIVRIAIPAVLSVAGLALLVLSLINPFDT